MLCYICKFSDVTSESKGLIETVSCPRCGRYSVDRKNVSALQNSPDLSTIKHIISGYLRYCFEHDLNQPILSRESIFSNIIENSLTPKDNEIQKKVLRLLEFLQAKTVFLGNDISVDFERDFSLTFSLHPAEFKFILQHLSTEGLINIKAEDQASARLVLTVKGFRFITKTRPTKKQIFVAMAFKDEMFELIKTIKQNVETATGYTLALVTDHEFNRNIDDRIIAEINRSHAIIADFSHNNPGVYFEAGYALGQGKEVIFTCQKGQTPGGDTLISQVHFDINHRNHILWDSAQDLETKLINRINATIYR